MARGINQAVVLQLWLPVQVQVAVVQDFVNQEVQVVPHKDK